MYAIDFEYRGELLSDYGMMVCSFDGSQDGSFSSGSDLTFNTIKSVKSNKFRLYSSTYEEAYTCEFSICKKVCGGDGELYLKAEEISWIQRWLCRKTYGKFKIDQDEYRNIYWNVVFTAKQREVGGKVVGFDLVLTADASYGYEDEVITNFEVDPNDSTEGRFTLYDSSDEIGYIYPDIKITLLEASGKDKPFILINSLDVETNRMAIANCSVGEIIKINGENQIIASTNPEHIKNDFNYRFPRIVNTYEDRMNIYTSNLKCKIELTYSPIKKIGL